MRGCSGCTPRPFVFGPSVSCLTNASTPAWCASAISCALIEAIGVGLAPASAPAAWTVPAAATINMPFMPASAWPGTVHSVV